MKSYSAIATEEGGTECAREVSIPLDVLEDIAPEEIPPAFRPDIEAPGCGRDAVFLNQSEVGLLRRCRCRLDWAWCAFFLCGLVILLAGGLADSSSKMLEGVEVRAELRTEFEGADATTTTTSSARVTSRTSSTAAPAVAAPTYFVTINTKSTPLVTKVGAPFEVFNLGMGKTWDGFKTKFELLLPFLENRAESDLIAFMDGADVFWGGCDMEQFLRSYHEIVNRSKAPIVISAEIACGEQQCWKVPKVPSWADNMSHQNLGGGFWADYVAPDGCRSTCCPCRKPPAVTFLNSGFMIGPMGEIRDLVRWSLENYDEVSTLGDQSVIAYYWFHKGRSKITLDYAGELCLTLSDLQPSALLNLTHRGHIWNKAFGRKQCFIHGNGRSRGPMWDLLGSFARLPNGKRYLKVFEKKKKEEKVPETEKEMKTLKNWSESHMKK
eukprot:s686_g14.t1